MAPKKDSYSPGGDATGPAHTTGTIKKGQKVQTAEEMMATGKNMGPNYTPEQKDAAKKMNVQLPMSKKSKADLATEKLKPGLKKRTV